MPATLTSIIVDDEPDAIDAFKQILHSVTPEVSVLAKANNAQTGLELIIDKHPDLLFLDVEMPGHNGFWLAEKLRHFENGTDIIFITAYNEYAMQAFKYAAFDFLTKPIDPENLRNTIERYKTTNNKTVLSHKLDKLTLFLNQKKIRLDTHDGFIMVNPDEIVYCQADGAYSEIFLSNGSREVLTMHLKLLEKKLPPDKFLRINRSTTIHLDYLSRFNRKEKTVTLENLIQRYELKVSGSGAKKLKEI
jgi:two-component system LytT family response regulator